MNTRPALLNKHSLVKPDSCASTSAGDDGPPPDAMVTSATGTSSSAPGAGADSVKRYFLGLENLTDRIAAEKLPVTQPFTPEAIAGARPWIPWKP